MARFYARAPYRARAVGYFAAMCILAGLLLAHFAMVWKLSERSKRTADREASLYAYALTLKLLHRQDEQFLADVMKGSEVPLLFTALDGKPRYWRNLHISALRPVPDAPAPLDSAAQGAIEEFTRRCRRNGDVRPIIVGATPVGVLYHSAYGLDWQMPAFTALGALAMLLLAMLTWFGLKIMEGTERSNLWVGLARETAHQLGTPISSLMGWLEYLRLKACGNSDEKGMTRIATEMDNDLGRLRQVVARFSQIGSLPDLQPLHPNGLVQQIHDYFTPRLPHTGRKVHLEMELGDVSPILANSELLGWVLENLVKNALDAMDREEGRIRIRTSPIRRPRPGVRIDVEDNGRGIPREHVKDVFLTGWSTKKRGWGLGLALARRIVEQYHGGRIWVERSRLGEGTTFSIVLESRSADHGGRKSQG